MNDLISQINTQLDIVDIVSEYVPLAKKGKNFWGVCPFHQDSNPSMSVSSEKQIYKCFSCGASGGIINFVADIKKISFNKALAELAEKIGVKFEDNQKPKYSEEQQKMIAAFADATMYMQYLLNTPDSQKALDYAIGRNMTPRIIERFKIGYSAQSGLKEFLVKKGHDEAILINASLVNQRMNDFFQDRLMFPIANEHGDVIGFSARALNGEQAKYINSSESIVFHKSAILYNFANAQDVAIRNKEIYICEGQMDVIALDKAGLSNAVAVMGTALTKEHLRLIKDMHVILNFDSDQAGNNATLKSIKLLLDNKFKVSVVKNEQAKDADDIFNNLGQEKLVDILETHITGLEWVYQKHLEKFGIDSPEQVEGLVKSFSKYLLNVSLVEKDFYAAKMSKDLPLAIQTISSLLNIGQGRPLDNFPFYRQVQKAQVQEIPKFEKKNYSYALIRSVITKPMLVNAFIQKIDQINFIDRQLIEIGKYLVAVQRDASGLKPSPEMANKVSEILKEDAYVAANPEEFEDLIKKVNNEFYDHYINEYKVKLKIELDEDKKSEYLSAIMELKRKKGDK